MPRMQAGGFTLIEFLVVIALLGLIAGMAVPRVAATLLESSLVAEARYAHGQAQAVRQFAIVRGRDIRIEYINSVPARIRVIDHLSGSAVPEFDERVLPAGFSLLPLSPVSKSVTYNSRGEATWLPSVTAPNRIILRAPNGQERHLLFHSAGRIMLVKP
ncbi:MAG: prepilin-type N-terminal cleavage/methylation domain-containing protein [Thermaerobacter sp.]|nr:prepilin-type N-terminal cleavage/methylation domain-containing protein [Thermaerobacter sp.]